MDGSGSHRLWRWAAGGAAVVATSLTLAGSAAAYSVAPGWIATDYATGFTFVDDRPGPVGLVFDGGGNLLVTGAQTGALYKFAPGGGAASQNLLRDGYGYPTGLAFGKDGRLYMARALERDVIEVNPASGEIIRTVVAGLPAPVGLATDPVSGDLFVSNVGRGSIMRISGFQDGPGVATSYTPSHDADGLTFGPDGTLWAAAEDQVLRISGTNTASPGEVTVAANVPNTDGIVYAPATARDDAYLVVVRIDGEIDRVDFDGRITPIVTGASRGDLVTVGPDRCIYADLQDRVIKLGPSSGECFFDPPVQPGISQQGVLGDRVAGRVVDTAIKASAPRVVRRGSRFTLRLTARNRSRANTAHTVVVRDTLPRGTRFVSARATRGVSCRPDRKRRTVTCRKRSLAPGALFRVQIVLRAIRGSRYTNTATVKSNDLDSVPGNNRSRSRTRVKPALRVLGVRRDGRHPRTTG